MQDLPGMNVAWPQLSDNLQFTDAKLRNLIQKREGVIADERLASFFQKHLLGLAVAAPETQPNDILVAEVGVDTSYSVAIGGIDTLNEDGVDLRVRFDALSV